MGRENWTSSRSFSSVVYPSVLTHTHTSARTKAKRRHELFLLRRRGPGQVLRGRRHFGRDADAQAPLAKAPQAARLEGDGALLRPARSLCSLVCKWTYEVDVATGSYKGWSRNFFRRAGMAELEDKSFSRLGNEVLRCDDKEKSQVNLDHMFGLDYIPTPIQYNHYLFCFCCCN